MHTIQSLLSGLYSTTHLEGWNELVRGMYARKYVGNSQYCILKAYVVYTYVMYA